MLLLTYWYANLCQDSISVFCQVSISVFCQVGIGVFLSNRFIRHNPRVIATRQQQRAPTPPHTCVFARRLILRRRDENQRLLLWSSG